MSVKSGFADSHVRISANILDRMPEIGSHGFTPYVVTKHHENYKTGRCSPSLKRLAKLTRFGEMTVIKYIRLLESCGPIDIRPSWSSTRRTSNQYDFIEFWNFDDSGSVENPWQASLMRVVEMIHPPSGGRNPSPWWTSSTGNCCDNAGCNLEF